MAEKRSTPSAAAPTSTLQRGKACLRCRKRKMKCDGAKPACQQCVRAKKTEACEYDDGKGKTRTQLMREHIARLELRIKELENPDHASPPVTLFDPHAPSPYFSESSSSSSHDSPRHFSLSTSASPAPFPLDMDTSPWDGQWNGIPEFPATPHLNDSFAIVPEEPPIELAQMLLDIFLPHRRQCGLEAHPDRLRESLHLPLSEQRHPVLMNSIYLWACYLSRPGSLSEHEPLYLARALAAMNDAVSNPSKVIDLIQASCLLSVYFLSNGRVLEGSFHASSAASLAIQWGLHQLGSELTPVASLPPSESPFKLEPAKDAIEQGERILTFWQVYNLDRCWSVALQRAATIPDSKHPWTSISTAWPQHMQEYEAGDVDIGTGSPTIHAFFVQQAQASGGTGGFSTLALRVKASALYEGASRLASSFSPRLASPNSFMDNFRVFEHTITRFTTTLLPLHQLGATMPDDKYTLIVAHCLAHASMIRLHQPFFKDDQVSREKSVRAARSLIVVAKHVADADFDYIDPIVGHCWDCAARVLTAELTQLQTTWSPLVTSDVRGELHSLLYSVSKLGAKYPFLGYKAAKLQKILNST